MNMVVRIKDKQEVHESLRTLISKIRALVIVMTDIDFTAYQSDIIDSYLDVLIELSFDAEVCCSELY